MKKKKYKVFTTAWHTMHFYDLFNALKKDCEFYLCYNTNKIWYLNTRPLPKNAHFVAYYEPGKYDFAILDVANNYGAVPILRPPEISSNSAASEDALLHALDFIKTKRKLPETFLFVQATSPLTLKEDFLPRSSSL